MVAIFVKPNEEQVKEWYNWVLSLNRQQNPFHPSDGGQFWNVNNTNKALIWLAGVIGRTQPGDKPSNIRNLEAIVAGSEARAMYDDGKGNPAQTLSTVNRRTISIKGDGRDLYIPAASELATPTEYPQLEGTSLSQLAKEIIDREDDNGVPPVFVDLDDGKHILNGNQLKTGFRVNGTINQLAIPKDNVFLLPPGSGPAAFSDYAIILKRDTLTPGTHTLRFGVDGKFFSYTVEYKIDV